MKKLFIILLLIIASIGLYLYLSNNKIKTPEVNEVLTTTDSEGNVEYSTGFSTKEIASDDSQSSRQLFTLLNQEPYSGSGFSIVPNKKLRKVEILLSEPRDDNMQNAKRWLEQNGFGEIDPKRLEFN